MTDLSMHIELDKKEIEYALRSDNDVAAIYRMGSRMDGTYKPDSDMDYMILLDRDEHYMYANTSFWLNDRFNIYVDHVRFTRKDLQEPKNMNGLVLKLMFLFGKTRGRKLIWAVIFLMNGLHQILKNYFKSMVLVRIP